MAVRNNKTWVIKALCEKAIQNRVCRKVRRPKVRNVGESACFVKFYFCSHGGQFHTG